MVIPCYLISIRKLVRGLIMEEIIFENEIAYKTKYDGYYVTKSGTVITTKVKRWTRANKYISTKRTLL